MTKIGKRECIIVCVVAVVAVSAFFMFFRNDLGWFIWNNTHWTEGALAFENKDPALYLDIGMYYFQKKHDFESAETIFKKAIEVVPEAPWIRYQLGRIYFIRGRFYQALMLLQKEHELYPEHKRVHYMLGLVYGYRGLGGDLEKAEENFEKFIAFAPKEWAGYNDLAWIQIKRKKFEEAKASVLNAFEIVSYEKDRNVWLWTSLGVAELNLGNYEEAKRAFLKAEHISGAMTADYFASAYPGNDPRNAEELFRQFQGTLFLNLGIVNEKLGAVEEARAAYGAYLNILPKGPYPTREEVEQRIRDISVGY